MPFSIFVMIKSFFVGDGRRVGEVWPGGDDAFSFVTENIDGVLATDFFCRK